MRRALGCRAGGGGDAARARADAGERLGDGLGLMWLSGLVMVWSRWGGPGNLPGLFWRQARVRAVADGGGGGDPPDLSGGPAAATWRRRRGCRSSGRSPGCRRCWRCCWRSIRSRKAAGSRWRRQVERRGLARCPTGSVRKQHRGVAQRAGGEAAARSPGQDGVVISARCGDGGWRRARIPSGSGGGQRHARGLGAPRARTARRGGGRARAGVRAGRSAGGVERQAGRGCRRGPSSRRRR